KHTPLIIFSFLVLPLFSFAGNIQVSNVTLTGQDVIANNYQVQFDLSWENSWRTSTFESNWDAAWVVIKYREEPGTNWMHANIAAAGSTFPSDAASAFAGDDGFFIYRDADGIGNVNYQNISIRWNYGNSFADDQVVEVCVIAMEMVYIPEGAFQVGDASSDPFGNFQAGITGNPFTITSEAALTLGGTSTESLGGENQNAMAGSDDFSPSIEIALQANYPKGFQAFYIMKYELSKEQYVNFLNKIPADAASNRFADGVPPDFGGYAIVDTGNPPEVYTTTAPNAPANWVSWADAGAYADWIALRPMTELEFEKACRGTRAPIPDEFAWGNAFISNETYTVLNIQQGNSAVQNLPQNTGNAFYLETVPTGLTQPFRPGILAFSSVNGTRQETGGSYYGVMGLSGNLAELVIGLGTPQGRVFNGSHGNGFITPNGEHNNPFWPNSASSLGTGVRAGNYGNFADLLRISRRQFSNSAIDDQFAGVGIRLVRTAP
ncbi:MAG: SUMF1/EgtB/PvdO family nonheme iron enzyme, partial [Bacteroidota bacterium]